MKPLASSLAGLPIPTPRDVRELTARHVMLPGHEVARARVSRRETVTRFLRRVGWRFKLPTICVINGEPVLRAKWRRRRLSAQDELVFVSKPWGKGSGGSGKQIIGLVAMIALAAIAPGIGGVLAGSLGITGSLFGISAGALLGAGIAIGGALLINALVAPKPGGQNDASFGAAADPIYSVSASGNVGKPLQPIPVQYGRVKQFCDFASTPWSEFVGNDQYLNLLLCVGCGKYAVGQILIDDTVLWDSATGVSADFSGTSVAIYDPGQPVTLFPSNITQSVEVSGQVLPDPTTPPTPGWVGGFIANAAGSTATDLALDFVFPGGLYTVDGNNHIAQYTVPLIAEARRVDNAGAPLTSFAQILNETFAGATRTPLRISRKISLGTAGRYEVRVRRTTVPISGTSGGIGADDVSWAGLRSYLQGPTSYAGVTTVAIRVLANAQLNASSARKFGVLSTRILPVWDSGTGTWVERPTQNKHWAFYDAATNTDYGAKRPVAKIDFQALVDGAAAADVRGDTFNFVFDQVSSIPAAFDTILKSARSRHRWSGDVLTCVRDEWRAVPEMLITDREIVRGSLSVDWLFNTDDSADAVVLEYLDENTWRPAEVQYPPDNPPSFVATAPARMRLDGVTNREHAYRECAFFYLQAQLRRTNVTLDTEHDGRRLSFGSAVRVQSELPQSWGASGRVVSRSALNLTLDPAPDWSESGQHYIGVRDKRGRLFGPVKCSEGGSAAAAVLDATDLATAEASGQTLDQALARADGAEDASFALGVGTTWSKPCVVLSGRPNGDRVTVSLFVDDQAVHTGSLGTVSSLPAGPNLKDPKVPIIALLSASFVQGVAEPRLTASWTPAAGAIYYLAEVSYDAGKTWTPIYNDRANQLSVLVEYAGLRLRVSGVGLNTQGAWTAVDVSPPTITVLPNTIALESLQAGIRDYVSKLQSQIRTLDLSLQKVAALAADQDAHNFRDRASGLGLLQTRTDEFRTGVAGVEASITSLQEIVANDEGALAEYKLTVDARLDGDEAQIQQTATAFTNLNESFGSFQTTVTARFQGNEANISANATALANLNSSFSSYQLTVNAQVGDLSASVSQTAAALATVDGKLQSTYQLRVGAGNRIVGFKAYNDGSQGGIIFDVDFLQIGSASAPTSVPVFTLGTVGGVGKLGFRGDMFLDGTVTASALNVGTLSAISANFGDATFSGSIKSAGYNVGPGWVLDATNNRFLVKDA